MNFDLIRPCNDCPFRTDCLKGWLGRPRATEIIKSIVDQQQTFACHKTTGEEDDSGETIRSDDEQHCAGAMIMLERIGRPGQLMRIAGRLGFYNHTQLDMDSPVFEGPTQFIRHHAGGRKAAR